MEPFRVIRLAWEGRSVCSLCCDSVLVEFFFFFFRVINKKALFRVVKIETP